MNNTVINISGTPLSESCTSLLSKGLSFAPTYSANHFHTQVDLFKFYRNLHLKAWYNNRNITRTAEPSSSTTEENSYSQFRPKSTFYPVSNNPCLIAFTKKVSSEVDSLFQQNSHTHANLTKNEHEALQMLQDNDELVIKPADKGGATVIWSRQKYTTEAHRQLDNTNFYVRVMSNPLDKLKQELNGLLSRAMLNNWITKKEYEYLYASEPCLATFYMLPKVHKDLENPPGRPIISGIGTISEPLSKFIDFFIKPYVSTLPSFVQDTTDVLVKLGTLKNIENAFLVTMDVESLYTNIDHNEGLHAIKHFLTSRESESMPPNDFILQLTEWTLTHNVFCFEDDIYRQIKGTAMGACFAPSYACLFLGLWEKEHIHSACNPFRENLIFYCRYIDDLLCCFKGTEANLLEFHKYVNSINPNIKLTLEYSQTEIAFLDLLISKEENGDLHTSIFRKSTDRNTILRADSFHSQHLIKNIPYGQFLRLKRICDTQEDYQTKSVDMAKRFEERGYKTEVVRQAQRRANQCNRNDLLVKRHKPKSNHQVYFSTRYSKTAMKIKKIIKNNWAILQSDPSIKEVFPNPPSFCFRRAPTLRDKLVHSHLPVKRKTHWLQKLKGNHRCGNCNHCENVAKSCTFVDVFTGQSFTVNAFANCNTTFVVYRLECECGCFYIGRTKRRLKDRVAEHKNAIRTKNPAYPMAVHYQQAAHPSVSSLKVMVIEVVPKPLRGGDHLRILLQRETFWISKLKATSFPGLNEECDFSPFL